MAAGFITVSYIGAAILFILSLSGLSQQETARRGNIFGVIGMLIAIVATIVGIQTGGYAVLFPAMIVELALKTSVSWGHLGVMLAMRLSGFGVTSNRPSACAEGSTTGTSSRTVRSGTIGCHNRNSTSSVIFRKGSTPSHSMR